MALQRVLEADVLRLPWLLSAGCLSALEPAECDAARKVAAGCGLSWGKLCAGSQTICRTLTLTTAGSTPTFVPTQMVSQFCQREVCRPQKLLLGCDARASGTGSSLARDEKQATVGVLNGACTRDFQESLKADVGTAPNGIHS